MPSVRDATQGDVAAIAAIYDHEARHGIATFHTSDPGPDHWTRTMAGGDPFLVAEVSGEVVGFAYATTYRPRPAYDRTREVSVYLAEQARGRGVGRALYAELLERLRVAGAHTALAVVALPNEASARLHESSGFVRVGTLQQVGRKLGRWVDTAIYQLML